MREAGTIVPASFFAMLPASKVTTAEPFPYRRYHLHSQLDRQQAWIAMNKLNSALLNLTTLALLALTAFPPGRVHADGGAVDTMNLTDEPGNWFKSQIKGTPVTVIRAGQR